MFEIQINSSVENYEVFVDVDLNQSASKFDFLIIDDRFQDQFSEIETSVFWVKCQESFKTLGQVELICEAMKNAGIRRSSSIGAVGGGIVQDLATLAASIYMRGIKWSYFPTTLTGMADSCLGGKSSINVGGTKNLVGNVYPPAAIYIDLSFAKTLPDEAQVSGLAEAVKICFAMGQDEFDQFIKNEASLPNAGGAQLASLIALSLQSKKWFIEKDEFDVAERQLLNFGHSFGHALEAACNFTIQHGVGVAVGMLAALRHPETCVSMATEKLENYLIGLLAPLAGALETLPLEMNWETFSSALKSDKKNTSSELCLILPGPSGGLEKIMIPFEQNAVEVARQALLSTLSLFAQTGEK